MHEAISDIDNFGNCACNFVVYMDLCLCPKYKGETRSTFRCALYPHNNFVLRLHFSSTSRSGCKIGVERVTQCVVDSIRILGYVTVEYYISGSGFGPYTLPF